MSSVGPVCHIPPGNTPANPQPQNLPGLPGPISPPTSTAAQQAFNNQIAAMLNAMRLMLLQLSGQLQRLNQDQFQGQTNNAMSRPQQGRWQEVSRQTETVKVYQNNDPTSPNWVEVERINQLKMGDSATKETWTWNR